MESAFEHGQDHTSCPRTALVWKICSALAVCAAFLLAIFGFLFRHEAFSDGLFVLTLVVLFSIAILHARFLHLIRQEQVETSSSLETQRRQAEEAKVQSLSLARSASQESDALRKTALALTQDVRMDFVLDNLLAALRSLVPYETAQVLLLETETKLFLARESVSENNERQLVSFPNTVDALDYPIIQRAFKERTGLLVPDTFDKTDWKVVTPIPAARSWLIVPIRSSDQTLGLLSLAHSKPHQFTTEHLRVTRSFAIPAALGIQNARLYERAEIYGAELGRLSNLGRAE